MSDGVIAYFNQVYDDKYLTLLRFVAARCANAADVSDLLQDIYADFYRTVRKKGVGYAENPAALLTTMAKARLSRYYRRQKKRCTAVDEVSGAEDKLLDFEKQDFEWRLIDHLMLSEVWELVAQAGSAQTVPDGGREGCMGLMGVHRYVLPAGGMAETAVCRRTGHERAWTGFGTKGGVLMHVTLHLTDACNLACRYCYVRKSTHTMSPETARAAIDFAARGGGTCSVALFGGEPMLCRSVIEDVVEYAGRVAQESRARFHFKMTTNGTLLSESFLDYADRHELFIALSFDGTPAAHDANRVDKDGSGTAARLSPVIDRLLASRPYAPVMMTVTPETVAQYAEGVKYLYRRGFRYLICSLNYAAAWDEAALCQLKKQYTLLADFYEALTVREEKFYLSPFEVKIASHVRSDYCAERCELGKKQVSVAPDGTLYPCVQFVGEPEYAIGDVWRGIDRARQAELFAENDREKQSCGLRHPQPLQPPLRLSEQTGDWVDSDCIPGAVRP